MRGDVPSISARCCAIVLAFGASNNRRDQGHISRNRHRHRHRHPREDPREKSVSMSVSWTAAFIMSAWLLLLGNECRAVITSETSYRGEGAPTCFRLPHTTDAGVAFIPFTNNNKSHALPLIKNGIYLPFPGVVTLDSKNDTDVAHYNFNAHQPILIILFWQRCC